MQDRCTRKRRIAAMNEDEEGNPLGVAIFLTPEQLAQLEIDPEATDVIEYHIEDGEVQLRTDCE